MHCYKNGKTSYRLGENVYVLYNKKNGSVSAYIKNPKNSTLIDKLNLKRQKTQDSQLNMEGE